ncbi:M23 family metallopeptidase [Nostoc sp. TCL26-01]|uniref:M23 family metallopeptidase n=1 Tax=Nostoc sp. TCL26-01 TaxID=2576904 RepID=UPI0015BBFB74|nr:M23 family metallopeptidase [Nostoc sp. TCL26-01]QLE57031.1 M23 family metallopeptidase [Nostoc sp. TCL26-01]
MFFNLAKKVTTLRCCTYGLIGLTSVLSMSSSALTQVAGNSSIRKTSVSIPVPSNNLSNNLIWPTQGYISQGFRKYRHEGIDIAGASGTPVVAVAAGKVVKAGWDDWGLGNAIEIKHSNGSVTVYGHNRRLLVSQGQQVKQGQIIAEMGSTGNSTAPHLHFEYYPNGRVAVNPVNFLASSTASKIPSSQIASSAAKVHQASKSVQPIYPPQVEQPVSPAQSIPIHVAPVNPHLGCTGVTVLKGETANSLVKVCEENGQLFYIGELKQDPSQPVKVPAWNIGNNKYRADNGSFSYLVSPEKVEIWRNGSQIRTDNFYTSTR